MNYFVYILTTKHNKLFYIGVTSHLENRITQHKLKLLPGYTKKYNVNKLIYFEEYSSIYEAITREKQLKKWHREWKVNLIEKYNPLYADMASSWLDAETSSA